MKKILLLLFVVASSVYFISCSKEGPTGPKGTANVLYSAWFTPNAYTDTTIFGIKNLYFNEAAPGITAAAMDSGVVLTFGKLSGYNAQIWPVGQVSQLPIIITYIDNGTQTDTWSALATVGNLRINFVNNTNLYNGISNAHSFRYIIIPSGAKVATKSALLNSDYHAICSKFGIPE